MNSLKQTPEADFSVKATKWIGSKTSIVLHTCFFVICFGSVFLGVSFERMLLFLTTIVSLEAIYLAIFIQMTVNRNTAELEVVGKDIDEIQEDIDEIQEDVDEIQEDIDEIQVDVDDIEVGETEDQKRDGKTQEMIINIQKTLATLAAEIEELRTKR